MTDLEFMHKIGLLMSAYERCRANGKEDMAAMWRRKAYELAGVEA